MSALVKPATPASCGQQVERLDKVAQQGKRGYYRFVEDLVSSDCPELAEGPYSSGMMVHRL